MGGRYTGSENLGLKFKLSAENRFTAIAFTANNYKNFNKKFSECAYEMKGMYLQDV